MDTTSVIEDPLINGLKKMMRVGQKKKYKTLEEAKRDLMSQQQAQRETLQEMEERHRELERLYKEERENRKHVYRFTPVEILEIKFGLEKHLEKMVVFLVGWKWSSSEAGYYYLWELPIKVGRRGIFDINKKHWAVPFQDLIQF